MKRDNSICLSAPQIVSQTSSATLALISGTEWAGVGASISVLVIVHYVGHTNEEGRQ